MTRRPSPRPLAACLVDARLLDARALACLLAACALAACDERTVAPPSGRADAAAPRADAAAADDASSGDADTPARDASADGDASATADDAAAPDATSNPGQVPGVALMARMAGLWAGPATQTVLGDFPRMILDFRPADDRTLFGRVDLDADNALRMAFFVETHGGTDVLVFRNGGLFMGLSRDTRTQLQEHDEARGTWRFCAIDGGCAYNESTFDLSQPDRLTLHVTVRGQVHLHWTPTRQESRAVPTPFPAAGSLGTGDAPFPPMPTLDATVRWSGALAADADVWLILSTMDCSLGGCVVSRHHLAHARAGDTSASLRIDQIHAGAYKVLGFLDRNRNVGTTLAPDSGDGVALPNQALTIAPSGTTTLQSTIVYDLP